MSDNIRKKLKGSWDRLKERINRVVNPHKEKQVPVLVWQRNRRFPNLKS